MSRKPWADVEGNYPFVEDATEEEGFEEKENKMGDTEYEIYLLLKTKLDEILAVLERLDKDLDAVKNAIRWS